MKAILLACLVSATGLRPASAAPLVEHSTSAPASTKAAATVQPANAKPAASTSRPPYISPGAAEVLKMTQAGVEPAVIRDFVEHSPSAYAPGAAEIIYLRDQGVSAELITALIRRGSVLRAQAMQSARQIQAQAAAAQPAAPTVVAAPQTVVQTVAQPVYVYETPRYVTYPYYYNNYFYTSPFAFRIGYYPQWHSGWGHHRGHHFNHHGGHNHHWAHHRHHTGHRFGAPYRSGFGAQFAAGPVRVGGSIHRRR